MQFILIYSSSHLISNRRCENPTKYCNGVPSPGLFPQSFCSNSRSETCQVRVFSGLGSGHHLDPTIRGKRLFWFSLVSLLVEVLGVFGEELGQAGGKRIERGIFVTLGLVFGQQLGKVGGPHKAAGDLGLGGATGGFGAAVSLMEADGAGANE